MSLIFKINNNEKKNCRPGLTQNIFFFFCLLSHEFDIDINLFGRKENLEEKVGIEAILIGTMSCDLHGKSAGFVGSTGRAL